VTISLQSKTQRVTSGAKGAFRKDSPTAVTVEEDDKPLIRNRQKTGGADGSKDVGSRASTPVPSEAVAAPAPASVQDESTQVEHAEVVDKGVQSTQIEMADESTQADLVVATPSPESVDAAAAMDGKKGDIIKARPEKPSRRSVLMEDSVQSTVASSVSSTLDTKIQTRNSLITVNGGTVS